jgi:predicted permease
MFSTTITVVTVCAPIFTMIVFGMLVRRTGMLTQEAQRFITWLVYTFSLPVIVFLGICKQDFRSLLNGAVLVSTFGATAALLIVAGIGSLFLAKRLRGPWIAAGYVANLAYMGFPLASNAFGPPGLTYAGIVNAFAMPVFTVLCCVLLSAGRDGHGSIWRQIRDGLSNPTVIAAFAGVGCSFLARETSLGTSLLSHHASVTALTIGEAILKPIGNLGLPLSLVAVGAALRFDHVKEHWGAISVSALIKLILAPLATLIICRTFFPAAGMAATGTPVLLMACPLAVATYVIGDQMGSEPGFLASDLAVTTAASCVTIPFWVAVVMRG